MTLIFNPLEPGYVENPFPHLADMRNQMPVHESPFGPWMLFTYEDCFRLLRDPKLSVDPQKAVVFNEKRADAFVDAMRELGHEPERSYSILNTDAPDHTRLRRLVSRAFTPRTTEGLRPMIERMVDAMLDTFAANGGGDLVSGLAFPLPFDVIVEMLGMPQGDAEEICKWSEALVHTLDPVVADDVLREAAAASIKMDAYIESVIAWKRENPGDDLLTAMIEAEEDGDRMSTVELRDQVRLLFVAGHETTVNLIGTGLYELLRNPDQAELWRGNPDIGARAVDELLRYVSPVQFSRRITTSDFEINGAHIASGTFVLASLASSNRDPAHFGRTANELDLAREDAGQHLSFGSGSHYCLGASLAKLEAQVAIGRFIERFSEITVVSVEWNGRINLRGLSALHFTIDS